MGGSAVLTEIDRKKDSVCEWTISLKSWSSIHTYVEHALKRQLLRRLFQISGFRGHPWGIASAVVQMPSVLVTVLV